MTRRYWFGDILGALVFALILGAFSTPDALAAPENVKVLIGFKQRPGPAEQALVRGAGGDIKYTYTIVPAIAANIPEVAIQGLLRNPNVVLIEPDIEVYAIGELDNTWGVKRISAGDVHDSGNMGTGVKVAIIDTGVDYTHPEFDSNYYKGGYDFVNRDYDPMDDNGHGTHVAGTVAAKKNDVSVVGVAPEVALYALKVLDRNGSGNYSDVIAALQWCVEKGIQVTNNSYGSSRDPGTNVKQAFDNAAAAGILHVAAAGNSGNRGGGGDNVEYPARYESVIAVAATDQNDARATFSSTGPAVELAAPGVSINSTYLGGEYKTLSGTSMASPHVAGVAALVIASGITGTDVVRQKLQSTADDFGASGRDNMYGYGLVNAAKAAISPTPPAYGTIAGIVTDATTENNPINGVTIEVDTGQTALTGVDGFYSIADVLTGERTVTASVNGYVSQSKPVTVVDDQTSTVNFTLKPVPEGQTMYVENITFSSKVAGKNLFLYTTVKVVNGTGDPLGGASVSMTLSYVSGSSWNFSGTTGSDGKVIFNLNKASSGNYTATVTTLVFGNYTWNTLEGVISASCTLNSDGSIPEGAAKPVLSSAQGNSLGSFPNPANPHTSIQYSLDTGGPVILKIYNVTGQLVRTLVDLTQGAGIHTAVWNGTDDHGQALSSGIYFCRLVAGGQVATLRISLIK